MGYVKPKEERGRRARETRQKIIAAAGELFLQKGYGATTLQQIADHAGVAVQTMYFVFGNKRAVLKELADVTVAGDDEPVATMDRPWFRDALAAPTADEHLRRHVHGTRVVLDRVAAIVDVAQVAAATDPEVAALWPRGNDPRLTVQTAAARSLLAKPGARADLSIDQAADVLFAILSPAVYLLLVRDREWSPERWEAWALEILLPQLCAIPKEEREALM